MKNTDCVTDKLTAVYTSNKHPLVTIYSNFSNHPFLMDIYSVLKDGNDLGLVSLYKHENKPISFSIASSGFIKESPSFKWREFIKPGTELTDIFERILEVVSDIENKDTCTYVSKNNTVFKIKNIPYSYAELIGNGNSIYSNRYTYEFSLKDDPDSKWLVRLSTTIDTYAFVAMSIIDLKENKELEHIIHNCKTPFAILDCIDVAADYILDLINPKKIIDSRKEKKMIEFGLLCSPVSFDEIMESNGCYGFLIYYKNDLIGELNVDILDHENPANKKIVLKICYCIDLPNKKLPWESDKVVEQTFEMVIPSCISEIRNIIENVTSIIEFDLGIKAYSKSKGASEAFKTKDKKLRIIGQLKMDTDELEKYLNSLEVARGNEKDQLLQKIKYLIKSIEYSIRASFDLNLIKFPPGSDMVEKALRLFGQRESINL